MLKAIVSLTLLMGTSTSFAGTLRLDANGSKNCTVQSADIGNRAVYNDEKLSVRKGNLIIVALKCSDSDKYERVILNTSSYAEASAMANDLINSKSNAVFYSIGFNRYESLEEVRMTSLGLQN